MAEYAESLAIYCLGGLRIERNGAVMAHWASRKAEALVVYLALTQRAHERELLATLLWDDRSTARALGNLSVLLNSLRTNLGDFVVANRQTVGLDWARAIWVDAHAFAGEATKALSTRHEALATAADARRLEQALDLYTGEFLAGVHLREASAFDEWALFERERLLRLAVEGTDVLVQTCVAHGRIKPGIVFAQRLLALDPLRESTYRDVMRLLVQDGQRNAALALFDRCFEVLERELGVEPDVETAALYEQIASGRLASEASGGHLSKPLEAPVSVERHNLPHLPTSFVGRAVELDRIRQRLDDRACRLLTLVGPGGVGKTRLALQAARLRTAAHPDGVWFVPLASMAQTTGIASAMAEAMSFGFSGDAEPFEQLLGYLRAKEMLLLLDNLEHLLGDDLLDLLMRLLAAAPGVQVLATSRERLGLDAEWLLDVPGLAFPEAPDSADAGSFPAVELFVQRAQRLRDDFALTERNRPHLVRLCQLVDGLPLALELAAAWIRTLAPAGIVAEVQRSVDFLATAMPEIPPRHRSVRAVFETSWQMLAPAEQEAFARLSVFRSSFDLASARVVAGASLAALSALVDKSFLRRDSAGRFRCHPLLLELAGERLREWSELHVATHDLHAAHFGRFLEAYEPALYGEDQAQALHTVNGELDNIRSAWRWAAHRSNARFFQQAVDAMMFVFDIDGLLYEGLDLCQLGKAGLAASEQDFGEAEAAALARVIALESSFEFRVGSFGRSRDLALEALRRLEQHRAAPWAFGHTLTFLGAAYFGLGDVEAALREFRAALDAYRQAGSAWGIGGTLGNIAEVHMVLGDQDAALEDARQAHQIIQQVGNPYLLTHNAYRLAVLLAQRGEYAAAQRYQEQSLEAARRLNYRSGIANATASLGDLALAQGDLVAAHRYYQEAVNLHEDAGTRLEVAHNLVQLGATALEAQDIDQALHYLRVALEEARASDAAAIALDALVQVARARWRQGSVDEAVCLLLCVETHEASSQVARKTADDLLRSLGRVSLPAPAAPCDLWPVVEGVIRSIP